MIDVRRKMVNIEKYLLNVDKPAQYLGNELNSVHKDDFKARMCLVFPDLYEIGMSSVGIRILYFLLNKIDGFYCERAFAPMPDDMEQFLRKDNQSWFSLESKTELRNFDYLAFSLSYELAYTNVLNILELSNIPLLREERTEEDPLIMAGGTCTMNPMPMSDFFDFFVIGDGEESMSKIAKIFVGHREKSKQEKLELLKDIDGVYIPSIHTKPIKKAVIKELDDYNYYGEQIVPYASIVHDRAMVEIQRGCTRGCRFCQAGMVYRPVRERSLESNLEIIKNSLKQTGYSEVSLSSLSSSDYNYIGDLLKSLQNSYGKDNLGISLPSLRMNPHSVKVANEIQSGKKTGFTFAPEAGTQRLRDVINKGVNEDEIIDTAVAAVESGWTSLKFYFMIGLPFETDEDVIGINELVKKVLYHVKQINKQINITVSVSNFVPKPHTPFQWSKQIDIDEMDRKHKILKDLFYKTKSTHLKIHDMKTSLLEGVISRGDEKIGKLILNAFQKGCKFDSWNKFFKYDMWLEAMDELGLTFDYCLRERELDEKLPWDIVDIGVSKVFYLRELEMAKKEALTQDCRDGCVGCGIKSMIEECGNLTK